MNDFPKPHWGQYGRAIIERLQLKEGPKGEWHCPDGCPNCGCNDKPSTRFWISEHNGLVRVHCRQCQDYQAIQQALQDDGLWPKFEPTNVVRMDDFSQPEPELNGAAVKFEPYHKTKQIDLIGAKLDNNVVVVPLFNAQKERVGEQRITPDGRKKFSAGLDKEGAFGVCGKIAPGLCYVAEGWATSVAVHMATGVNTVFALDAGNLPKVCDALQEVFPKLELIIAADNDEAGIKAVKASGRPYATPRYKGDDWNDVWVRDGKDAVCQGLNRVVRPKALFTHLDELRISKPDWLIDGLIERETLAMCFGAAGSGKTFAVLDMALSIATGKDYHGHGVKQGTVFYIAGEGHSGFARRSGAWKQNYGIGVGEAAFYKSNKAVIMSEPESVAELVDEMAKLVEVAGKPQLVVIDTLARSLGGADENAGKDINLFIVACDEIREQYGCTIMIVHHTGHQNKERGRGASQINAALDHEFRIEAWDETRIAMTFTKQKEDKMPEPKMFVKLPVEIMTDDMEEINSIVLEFTPEKPMAKGNGMPKGQAVLLKLFRELAENGEVERDILKNTYFDRFDTGNKESTKRKFNRDIRSLVEDDVLMQENGIISETYKDE